MANTIKHPAGIVGYLPPVDDGCALSLSCLTCPLLQPDCDGDPERAVEVRRKEIVVRLIKAGLSEGEIAAAGHFSVGYVADIMRKENLYGIRHPRAN